MNKINIREEINRCLNCVTKPCQKACPLGNNIPQIVALMKLGKMQEAYEELTKTTVLPAVCSVICPHDKQCKKNCTLQFKSEALNVGNIESMLANTAFENGWKISEINNSLDGKKIAVIGSGPAGLTAGAFLARYGARVSIFEKREKLGGVLMYGIPAFRLDKEFLQKVLEKLVLDLNIDVHLNSKLGEKVFLEELSKDFDAVLLTTGSNKSKLLNIDGVDLNGVYGGNELLENENHPDYKGKKVFVSGGGNVAIDTARIIKRKGAEEVIIIYRRSEEEMPASYNEIEAAKIDGVKFIFNANVVKIDGTQKVERLICLKTKYNVDGKLINIEDSEFEVDADYFVMSIGSIVDKSGIDERISLTQNDKVLIDENMQTTFDNFFAAGNLVKDNTSAAEAARSGRDAAEKIKEILINGEETK